MNPKSIQGVDRLFIGLDVADVSVAKETKVLKGMVFVVRMV